MAITKHNERYGPYMTANNAPAPFAATASQNNWGAFRAFSESLDDDISFTGLAAGTEQWVQIKLDAPIRVWAFRIACRTTVSAKDAGQVPKNFTVQGSVDGTTFDDIQTYTDIDWEQFTSWDASINKYDWADAKKIEISCAKEYQYYRFLFGECQSISTQKTGSMTPTSSNTVKPTLIDLYQVEGEAGPEVIGVRVTHMPDKVRYEAGEALDTAGLEVTADLSDGSTQVVTDYILSGFDSSTIGQKIVTADYQGHTAAFTVMVYTLSSIAITTPPSKIQYQIGEELDLTGMVVTATYSDGVAETITDYTVTGFDNTADGECILTISYLGKADSCVVTVGIVRELVSISISTLPSKLEYLTGEALDTTGMVVVATYEDGTEQLVTGYTLSGYNSAVAGTQMVTVTYREKTATFSVFVKQLTPLKLEVSPLPSKLEYTIGEALDLTGMVVRVYYDDGNNKEVTEYAVSGFDSTITGEKLIRISYTERNVTLETAFSVFVGTVVPTGIVVSGMPDKRLYALGESFDRTGLAVSLVYNSGKTEPVTNYALSGYDSDIVGIKTINVAYTPPAIDGQVVDILQTTFTVTVTKYGSNPFESNTSRKGMRIHWLDRPYIDVTSEEIQLDSFSLDQSICSDSSFRFGGCISSKFECKIFSDQFLDPDTYPDGRIQVYLQAGGEEVRVFTGIIDTADRTDSLNIRRIVAYDELKAKGGTNLGEFGAYVSKFSPGVSLLRKELLKYLGIDVIQTTLMYDAAMIPYNFDYSSLTALQLLKDICVNNMVWGWINPDGIFEYIKLPPNAYWKDGKHNYYTPEEVLTGLIKPATFKEGRIWYPYRFALNPDPYYPVDVGVEIPDLKAYEDNVYFIDNSPLIGDYDWISQVYREKTTYDPSSGFGSTTYELAGPIVLGPHFEQDDYSHRYLAREYTCKVKANPYRKIGTNIQFNVAKQLLDGRELTWTINSYIMSRKMTSANGLFIDTYSAKNGPYNPPAYGSKKETKGNTSDIGKLKKNMPRWKVYDGSGQSTEVTVETGPVTAINIMSQEVYTSAEKQEGEFYFTWEEE